MGSRVDNRSVDAFERDGAVVLRGVFTEWVETIATGIERNRGQPGPHFADNVPAGQAGRFWDDYCNWQRIPEYERFAFDSGIGEMAADLMQSKHVQLFHDHVLVKEPHTMSATPWHSDSPYYFVNGVRNVSFWLPLDPVGQSSLRFIRGSHLWEKDVMPVKWLSGDQFYGDPDDYLPVPDPDADDRFEVLEWEMAPGDAVAFHFRTVHGARGNKSSARRRAFSLRLVGDDTSYITRPGPTSPPFPGHGMTDGDTLRADWFPYLVR